ncbi:MAG: hypothetical protein AAF564_24720, partial [Bacteroidota bacterium]
MGRCEGQSTRGRGRLHVASLFRGRVRRGTATGLIASLYDTEFDDSWGEYYIARIQEVLGNRNRALYRV